MRCKEMELQFVCRSSRKKIREFMIVFRGSGPRSRFNLIIFSRSLSVF